MNNKTQSSPEESEAGIEKTMVLSCRQLSKTYDSGTEEITVLNQLDFQVRAGQRIAVTGSSGCGKTTLLNLLAGLDKPTSGTITVAGKNLNQLNEQALSSFRNQWFGFVYQFHHLLAEFTAVENVAMPLLMRRNMSLKSVYLRAESLLTQVGLAERLQHKPATLSGGERQRVAIARALVTEPALVFMDEPTGNLDTHTATAIHTLMLELSQLKSTSFVVVTHDQNLAAKMDRTYCLSQGRLDGARD